MEPRRRVPPERIIGFFVGGPDTAGTAAWCPIVYRDTSSTQRSLTMNR